MATKNIREPEWTPKLDAKLAADMAVCGTVDECWQMWRPICAQRVFKQHVMKLKLKPGIQRKTGTRFTPDFVMKMQDAINVGGYTSFTAAARDDFMRRNNVSRSSMRELNAEGKLRLLHSEHPAHKPTLSELFGGAINEIKDEAKRYKPVIYRPVRRKIAKPDETVLALLSDLHIYKRTLTFNFEVLRERLYRWAEKLLLLTDMKRSDRNLDDLVLAFLGDFLEGEDIFPGQAYMSEGGAGKQVVAAAGLVVDVIKQKLLPNFKRILVKGVPGNHGRTGKGGDPATNFDTILYQLISAMLSNESRVSFDIQTGHNVVMPTVINGWGCVLCHGQKVRAGGPVPWYGLSRAAVNWCAVYHDRLRTMGADYGLRYVFSAHLHTTAEIPAGRATLYVNGCFPDGDPYAEEDIRMLSVNVQRVFGINSKTAVPTFEEKLDLLK